MLRSKCTTRPRSRAVRRTLARAAAGAVLLVLTAAPAATAATTLADPTTNGLNGWIKNNLVNLGLLVVGAVIIFRGRSKDWSGALVTGGIAIFGLLFVSLGTGTNGIGVGDWLLKMLNIT